MISTTPKRSRTDLKDKAENGKLGGMYETTDLKEKVMKWQAPSSSPAATKNAATGDSTKSAMAATHADDDFTLAQDLKAATTPRKRVVSDGHWRKAQLPSGAKATSPQKTPMAVRSPEPSFYVRPGSAKVEGWVRKRPAQTARDMSPLASTSPNQRKTSTPKLPASDIELKELKSVPASRQRSATEPKRSPVARDTAPTTQPLEFKNVTPIKTISSGSNIKDWLANDSPKIYEERTPQDISTTTETPWRKSPTPAQRLPSIPKAKPVREDTTPRKTSRNYDTTSSRTSTSDHEKARQHIPLKVSPVPPKSGYRLETWLSSTKDPFVDNVSEWGEESEAPRSPISTADTAHIVKPRTLNVQRISSRRRTYTYDGKIEKSAEHYQSPTKPTYEYRVLQATKPEVVESVSEDDYFSAQDDYEQTTDYTEATESATSPPVTPTLQRRGARRKSSPVKMNAYVEDDNDSAISGDLPRAAPAHHTSGRALNIPRKQQAEPNTLWNRSPHFAADNHLSTITSAESLNSSAQDLTPPLRQAKSAIDLNPPMARLSMNELEKRDHSSGNKRPSALRKMTSHADLMSVLSMPDEQSRSLKPANSVRAPGSMHGDLSIADILEDLNEDEDRYNRELRTLVDGVIPVLLNCVLSKSNYTLAAGLCSSSKGNTDASAPIVAMGVALERLKSAHQRMPKTSAEALLTWAQGSHRIYEDYLHAWRLGFQDVVVNLAPAEERRAGPGSSNSPWDHTLGRNDDGYVVNEHGGKVDVAHLLKRPLVRLKYLARTLKDIERLVPSTQASLWLSKYQDLVGLARRRQDEERARLEDEMAANIDATRARDVMTLAPAIGSKVDPSRCVKARDLFTLKFQHSTGQRIDCDIEIILRENRPGQSAGGDALICGVDGKSKWLLLSPITLDRLSSRAGDASEELVLMVRGFNSSNVEWFELLHLFASDPGVKEEWIELLGSQPYPPLAAVGGRYWGNDKDSGLPSKLTAMNAVGISRHEEAQSNTKPGEALTSKHQRASSTAVVIGSTPGPDTYVAPSPIRHTWSPVSGQTGVGLSRSYDAVPGDKFQAQQGPSSTQDGRCTPPQSSLARQSPYPSWFLSTGIAQAQSSPSSPAPSNLQRDVAPERQSRVDQQSAGWSQWRQASPVGSRVSVGSGNNTPSPRKVSYVEDFQEEARPGRHHNQVAQQPGMGSSSSSTGAQRHTMHLSSAQQSPVGQSFGMSNPQTLVPRKKEVYTPLSMSPINGSPHANSGQGQPSSPIGRMPKAPRSPRTPKRSPRTPASSNHRRSSSPLKREYLPSSGSESSMMGDNQSNDGDSITSESSGDEWGDSPMPRRPIVSRLLSGTQSPKGAVTITASQSASQGPQGRYYAEASQLDTPAKMIASIFCWSDKGVWESIHPNECSVTVTAGLIEAFEMSAAHSQLGDLASPNKITGARPLVGLELTPLVPLRRGTALDITIRSPPTANCTFHGGNHIMFRSRNAQECDTLYNLINQARINNPTYIAMQNANGAGSTWAAQMDRRGNKRSSWWQFGARRNSYRKSSNWRDAVGADSSIAQTSDSPGSLAGKSAAAVSALKRFTSPSKNRVFSVAKSTVSSRGRVSDPSTIFTSSSGSTGGEGPAPIAATAVGIANGLKVRLYARETQGKWRDLGAARLSIMNPPITPASSLGSFPPIPPLPGAGAPLSEHSFSPPPQQPAPQANTKRILVTASNDTTYPLLDVTLPETSFERVARTGIAVSVWEELVGRGVDGEIIGTVASTGGVMAGKGKVYMVQLKSEAEAAWVFGLVGRLRY